MGSIIIYRRIHLSRSAPLEYVCVCMCVIINFVGELKPHSR